MPLNPDSSKLRVVNHDPVREKKIKIILVLTTLILGVSAYWYGGSSANNKNVRLEAESLTLGERTERLTAENDQFRQRITILESASTIDREAVNNVRQLVRKLEDEKEQLNKELTFYKNILAPEDLAPGVRIAGLDLEEGNISGWYRFRLVVSQIAQDNPFRRGSVSIFIEGRKGGKSETVSLLKLAGYSEDTAPLGFRYFQSLPENRGFLEFELPDGFIPGQITINGRIQRGPTRSFEKTFDWNKKLVTGARQE